MKLPVKVLWPALIGYRMNKEEAMSLRYYCYLLLCLGLGACSKPLDLDTPCPDYGRYCTQTPINVWDNKETSQ
jgi:hypothetical protein